METSWSKDGEELDYHQVAIIIITGSILSSSPGAIVDLKCVC